MAQARDLEEARKVANRLTLKRLVSEVEADSAADLTNFLNIQLKKYPGFVQYFAQTLHTKNLEQGERKGTHDTQATQDTQDGQRPPRAADSVLVSDGLPLEILRPLSPLLLKLLSETKQGFAGENSVQALPEDFVAAINHQLAEAERLHELQSNLVLGLGPSVAVKVSPFLDMDHLYNLRCVSWRVPDTPVPQGLSALRSSPGPISSYRGPRA